MQLALVNPLLRVPRILQWPHPHHNKYVEFRKIGSNLHTHQEAQLADNNSSTTRTAGVRVVLAGTGYKIEAIFC